MGQIIKSLASLTAIALGFGPGNATALQVAGDGWGISASASEWVLKDRLGPVRVVIVCPRIPNVGSGYMRIVIPDGRVPKSVSIVSDAKVRSTYLLRPETASAGSFIWRAESDQHFNKLLSEISDLTLSDVIRVDGVGIAATESATNNLETLVLYGEKCHTGRPDH